MGVGNLHKYIHQNYSKRTFFFIFIYWMIKPSLPSHCKPKKHWEHAEESHTSMVGSYSSTKWFWMSWMVSALLPTPPAPTTTSLYSVILAAAAHRTHTHTHAAAGEERGDRKRQVSILTDTHTHTHSWTGNDAVHKWWYRQSILILPLLPSGEKT